MPTTRFEVSYSTLCPSGVESALAGGPFMPLDAQVQHVPALVVVVTLERVAGDPRDLCGQLDRLRELYGSAISPERSACCAARRSRKSSSALLRPAIRSSTG